MRWNTVIGCLSIDKKIQFHHMVSIAPIEGIKNKDVADVPSVIVRQAYTTDTIKAAPHSFSNKGDAFSHLSELLFFSRSIMIMCRVLRNPSHHGTSLPQKLSLRSAEKSCRLGASRHVARPVTNVSATPI